MLVANNIGLMTDMCVTLSLVNDSHLTDNARGSGVPHPIDKCIKLVFATEETLNRIFSELATNYTVSNVL